MNTKISAKLLIKGRVQGVGFRWFARQWADDFNINGWVRNNYDRSVEIDVEGKRERIENFIEEMRRGPSAAHVDDVQIIWGKFDNKYQKFEIRHSDDEYL